MSEPYREPEVMTLHEPMSFDEYLAFEESSETRHEYVEGYVYAMSGATGRHEQIVANMLAHFWMAARGGPRRAYGSNLKLRVPRRRIYYPDAMVICAADEGDVLVAESPCLLAEVTSPSSARTDRTEKRDAYLEIGSLRTYIIADQRRRQVDHWARRDDGEWHHETLIEQGALSIPCPGLTFTLDEIYEGVALPPLPVRRIREPEPAFGAG